MEQGPQEGILVQIALQKLAHAAPGFLLIRLALLGVQQGLPLANAVPRLAGHAPQEQCRQQDHAADHDEQPRHAAIEKQRHEHGQPAARHQGAEERDIASMLATQMVQPTDDVGNHA